LSWYHYIGIAALIVGFLFSPLVLYFAGFVALGATYYGAILGFFLWLIFELFLAVWIRFLLQASGRNLMLIYMVSWLLTENSIFEKNPIDRFFGLLKRIAKNIN
jgi:hypothetical protein